MHLPTAIFFLTSLLPLLSHARPSTPLHSRQVTLNETQVGVYTCDSPNWQRTCTWDDTSGTPRCRLIPFTDALTHAAPAVSSYGSGRNDTNTEGIARVSIGPDRGNHCIVFESARCEQGEKGEGSYLLRYPGTTDLVEWGREQGLEDGKRLWSMLCLDESLVPGYYRKAV